MTTEEESFLRDEFPTLRESIEVRMQEYLDRIASVEQRVRSLAAQRIDAERLLREHGVRTDVDEELLKWAPHVEDVESGWTARASDHPESSLESYPVRQTSPSAALDEDTISPSSSSLPDRVEDQDEQEASMSGMV